MEQRIDELEVMRQDLVESLAAALGPRDWSADPGDTLERAGCPGSDDAAVEVVSLPLQSFDGTYPAAEWDTVQRIVDEVVQRHGFPPVQTVADRPGDLVLETRDERAGKVVFGMAENTVLRVQTGCHRWSSPPSPS